MAFDYSTLITDRAQSDIDALKALVKKPMSQWTAEEAAAFKAATLKGSYDYTDLNRVNACMENLVSRLNWQGYNVPGYERVEIGRTSTPTSCLPAGYTEVAYIQSSGTQYVDTGFQPNQDTRLVSDIEILNVVDSQLLGARASAGSQAFNVLVASATAGRDDWNNETINFSSISGTGRWSIDKNKNVTTINKTTINHAAGTFSTSATVFLFAVNNNGSLAQSTCAIVKLYSCQIYDNGTLVRDFVPYINASNAVGLYDLVNGQFYGNAGTGTFTAAVVK